MARIVLEDAVLYILAFHIVCSIFFSVNMFDSYFPGKAWNSTTGTMEAVPAGINSTPSMFGNTSSQLNESLSFINSSLADPMAMINPLQMLLLLNAYIKLLMLMISTNYLYIVIALIVGPRWAFALTLFINAEYSPAA